jgi:carboxylesterase type B
MSDYWVGFAATGDPNGGDRPYWPTFIRGSREYLELGDRIQSGTGIRADHCDLYDELQQRRLDGGRQAPESG